MDFNLKEALLETDEKGELGALHRLGKNVEDQQPRSDDFPDLKPLPDELLPVDPFDFNMLPETLIPWAKDISDRMQCAPDYVAVTIMVVLGTVVGRKVKIRGKQFDDWEEVPNQWAMLIGRPGTLKSPAMEEALFPLKRLEAKADKKYQEQMREHQTEVEAEKILLAKRKKDAKELDSKDEIKRLLSKSETPSPPTKIRYRTNDTTIAAMGELLIQNQNGILAYRDELVSLLKGLDREENTGDRGFYLTGWSGQSGYTFDRIVRGLDHHIPAVTISLLGSTQPGRISGYIKQAINGGNGDDGLIQRFGLMVWPDISKWKDVDRPPDKKAKGKAFEIVKYLNTFDPMGIGAEQETDFDGEQKGIPFFRFSEDALNKFREWRTDLENGQLREDIHPALESHYAKYRKLVPTLALLIHLAEYGKGPVTKTALLKALAWSEYLKTHVKRIYGSVTSSDVAIAKRIVSRIKKGDLKEPFASRDVWRPGWSGLTDSKVVAGGLQMLVDCEWLFIETKETSGRPATIYTVNPKLTPTTKRKPKTPEWY